MALIFIDKVKNNQSAFELAVMDTSRRLGINPNWLMAVMYFESGLNPQAQNTKYLVEGKPATGLIQFVKSTAENLGTTIEALYRMSNVEQMYYVEKYLANWKGKYKSYIDVYMAVFFPAAIGLSDVEVVQTKKISASAIAKSNPIFDINKDGKVTIAEVKQAFVSKIPNELRDFFFSVVTLAKKKSIRCSSSESV